MATLSRRDALRIAAGSAALAVTGVPAHAAANVADAITAFTGGRTPEAGRIMLDLAASVEDGNSVPFALTRVVLGKDSDGDEVSSCVVVRDTSALFTPKEPSGSNQKRALRAVRQELKAATATGRAGAGSHTKCIPAADAKAAVVQKLVTTPANKRNTVAQTFLQGLVDSDFLGGGVDQEGEGWVWEVS